MHSIFREVNKVGDWFAPIGRRIVGAGAMLLAVLLGGCGLVGDNSASVFIAPGKYDIYNCDQLAEAGRTLSARERELTGLMARAADGAAGEFVGAVAYRSELLQARGQIKQIDDASVHKNCTAQSKWQSERALW